MANNPNKQPDTTSLADIFNDEYYQDLFEKLVEILKTIQENQYKKKVHDGLEQAVDQLVQHISKLATEKECDFKEVVEEYVERLNEAFELSNQFLTDAEGRLEDAGQKVWQNYQEVKEWWEQECKQFGRYTTKVFDAVAGLAGIGPEDYKRVALIPTTRQLQVEPASTGTIVKVLRGLAYVVEIGSTLIINPLGLHNILTRDVTRILFYKSLPPCINPWNENDDRLDERKRLVDNERPIEFPIPFPVSTIIPITFVRDMPTRVFAPFRDREECDRKMMAGIEFLFCDKLYENYTNWIWLFLDLLNGEDKEINRYGFGWYLQGHFFKDRSLQFSLEKRFFIDAIHIDFTAEDSKGRSFNSINSFESNSTNNVYLNLKTGANEYRVTTEFRSRQDGMVGRKVALLASVQAEVQIGAGGKIGIVGKLKLPHSLITTIREVGDEMISNEVIESVERMKASLEKSIEHFHDMIKTRCPRPGCAGVGEPIGYKLLVDEQRREYRCNTCKQLFTANQSDAWDRVASGHYSVGNFLASQAHLAHAFLKTGWAMLEVLSRQSVDPKCKVELQIWGQGRIGPEYTGPSIGASLGLKAKIFAVTAPLEMMNSPEDWLNLAELMAWIYYHVFEQARQDIEKGGALEVALIITELLIQKGGRLLEYYLKAVPLALRDLRNSELTYWILKSIPATILDKIKPAKDLKAWAKEVSAKRESWVKRAYKDITLSIGTNLGGSAKIEGVLKLSASVKLAMLGLECNLGAFCEDVQGDLKNVYKFSWGNKFGIKAGGSIPSPGVGASAEVGIEFPLKTIKVNLETSDSLFLRSLPQSD